MGKLSDVWVVSQNAVSAAELCAGAAALGENTALVWAGPKDGATGAGTAYWLGEVESTSFVSYIPAIVALVQAHKPQLVLCDTSKNGRLAAGSIAAAMGANVMTDLTELDVQDGAAVGVRMVYGGAAFKTEKATAATAVACVGGGVFAAGEGTAPAQVVEVEGKASPITFVGRKAKQGSAVNIAAAKCVVAVGRGLGSAEKLPLAQELAKAMGGEVGCSRPVAEEEKWLPKEVYLGVSGAMIKPDVYIGCGISGQVQHMVGVGQAKTIVAVNKDKNAPIFKQCDYGLVGDLATVLPALAKKFQG